MSRFRLIVVFLTFLVVVKSKVNNYKLDITQETKTVWPFWESCTTADHAYLGLRQDWIEQLTTTYKELGIKKIRFFGIFNDDIGIVNTDEPSMPYSYYNVDQIYDAIFDIGMEPIVELDFVPSPFLDDPTSHLSDSFHYGSPVYKGPPSNNTQWYEFIKSFIQHLVDRYGLTTVENLSFDFWDEPNTGKWINNNLTTFEETYLYTYKAIQDVSKNITKIGAPGTANAVWIPDFVEWAVDKSNSANIDYVSTHLYPTNSYCKNLTHNGYFQCLQTLGKNMKAINNDLNVGITAYGCTFEKGTSIGLHDTNYNSACFMTFASQFQELDSDIFSLMCFTGFTDLWDQKGTLSTPFHNGYGWLTDRGIKKPTFHALKLLHQYATDRVYFPNINGQTETNTTLELFATMNTDKNELAIFISNWMLSGYDINNETVSIDIVFSDSKSNCDDLPANATLYRIDNDNCNPQIIWQQLGSPSYPTQQQINAMEAASDTYPNNLDRESCDGTNSIVQFQLDVPEYGLALLIIPF